MKSKHILSQIFNGIIKPLFKISIEIVKAPFVILGMLFERISSNLRFSITFRMTSSYAFAIMLILTLLSVGILFSGFAYILKSEGDDLQKDFTLTSAYIEKSLDIPKENIKELSVLSGVSITIFDENRNMIYTTEQDSNSMVFIDKYTTKNIVEEYENKILIANMSGVPTDIPKTIFNEYGFALVLNDSLLKDSTTYYIQVIDNLSEETAYAGIFVITLLSLDLAFIILMIFIGSSISKKLLRPIQTMTDTVKSITINQLDTRLNIKGSKNELKDLGKTFNNMLDRIQTSYEKQNQFVSDVSHELRTPISVIQGYAGLLDRWGKDDRVVLEESIEAIKTESESMKSLIEKLLFLARGDSDTQKIIKEDFNIAELIDDIIKETRLIDNTHEITCEENESAVIYADRNLIKEALRIFIDNSIKYTHEGGKIKLTSSSNDSFINIVVEDTGMGIPKEELPHIFDRFYRADKSRTKQTGGTGLGLAIAKWIVLKHGGTIHIQSEVNIGTKIYISIPAKC